MAPVQVTSTGTIDKNNSCYEDIKNRRSALYPRYEKFVFLKLGVDATRTSLRMALWHGTASTVKHVLFLDARSLALTLNQKSCRKQLPSTFSYHPAAFHLLSSIHEINHSHTICANYLPSIHHDGHKSQGLRLREARL